MVIPNLFSITATITVLLIYFRKSIPKKYDLSKLKEPEEAINDPKMFRLSWCVLGILLLGYFTSEFINIPVSIIAGTVAVFYMLIAKGSSPFNTKSVIKGALGI